MRSEKALEYIADMIEGMGDSYEGMMTSEE